MSTTMIIYSRNNIAAVFKWGEMWYEPLTPTGYTEWITDNLWAIPFVKSRPLNMLALGLC
jgi:hypothetical protein